MIGYRPKAPSASEVGGTKRLVSTFNPLRGCNSGKALLIGLTRLFCKQQRSSTSTSTNAEREAPGEGNRSALGIPGARSEQPITYHFSLSPPAVYSLTSLLRVNRIKR
jgi:hypothetical protein